ncbi:MAG: type II secretion system protein J [Chthoniobacteraceae bacterium]
MKIRAAVFVRPRGFTLLELLVAMAVLCFILAILLQISGQVVWATRFFNNQMDASRQNRAVLDTLAADLSNRITSAGETIFTRPQGNNSELIFITRSRGPSASTDFRFLAVDYKLATNQVIRKTQEVYWNSIDLTSLALGTTSSTVSDSMQGILRLEVVAVLSDGSLAPLPASSSSVTWAISTWQGSTLSEGFQALIISGSRNSQAQSQVRAIIVAVASLDPQSLQIITRLNIDLANKLPAATSGQTPVGAWNTAIANGALAGVPSSVVSSLQFSQQIYPLNTP